MYVIEGGCFSKLSKKGIVSHGKKPTNVTEAFDDQVKSRGLMAKIEGYNFNFRSVPQQVPFSGSSLTDSCKVVSS
jgi:hypothetical protein